MGLMFISMFVFILLCVFLTDDVDKMDILLVGLFGLIVAVTMYYSN